MQSKTGFVAVIKAARFFHLCHGHDIREKMTKMNVETFIFVSREWEKNMEWFYI